MRYGCACVEPASVGVVGLIRSIPVVGDVVETAENVVGYVLPDDLNPLSEEFWRNINREVMQRARNVITTVIEKPDVIGVWLAAGATCIGATGATGGLGAAACGPALTFASKYTAAAAVLAVKEEVADITRDATLAAVRAGEDAAGNALNELASEAREQFFSNPANRRKFEEASRDQLIAGFIAQQPALAGIADWLGVDLHRSRASREVGRIYADRIRRGSNPMIAARFARRPLVARIEAAALPLIRSNCGPVDVVARHLGLSSRIASIQRIAVNRLVEAAEEGRPRQVVVLQACETIVAQLRSRVQGIEAELAVAALIARGDVWNADTVFSAASAAQTASLLRQLKEGGSPRVAATRARGAGQIEASNLVSAEMVSWLERNNPGLAGNRRARGMARDALRQIKDGADPHRTLQVFVEAVRRSGGGAGLARLQGQGSTASSFGDFVEDVVDTANDIAGGARDAADITGEAADRANDVVEAAEGKRPDGAPPAKEGLSLPEKVMVAGAAVGIVATVVGLVRK